ncbi:MAG: SDR family oxidoreductase [Candidatus Nanopelagicales bacterium]
MATSQLCLVTGPTGYIGGRLVPALLAEGKRVRVFARHPERLRDMPWAADVEVVAGDANDPHAVAQALRGVDVGYYLLHSLTTKSGFSRAERSMAQLFADTAFNEGVGRLVYLGGLVPPGDVRDLSEHLRSRAEVGEILRRSGVPTAELRAAVILGSGSASFEMLRYLTERLPAMVTPKWVHNRIQPIAIRDVLRYLVGCADLAPDVNRAFDIGGPDVITYSQMMQRYAAISGLRRRVIVPVPVLSPNLSSHWVGVITPVPASIARPLVESLRHEVICREDDILEYIPEPESGLLTVDEAIDLAVRRVRDAQVATRWSSVSVPGAPSEPLPTDPDWAGGSLYTDSRERTVQATPAAVWSVVRGVGGRNGWYSFPLAWELRGLMDRAVGGVGLRRGRRDPNRLFVGETVDFWRVEELVPENLLRLRAEMKLPGLAWLEFSISATESGAVVLRQRATFYPRGLAGHIYWYSVMPFHGVVFGSMIRNMAAAAVSRESRVTQLA